MAYSHHWMQILNEVQEFTLSRRPWFRGHSSLDYELHSGLFRLDFEKLVDYHNVELISYRQFINLGHLHHNESDWSLLYLMQHHGVITRLLDWSMSFNTALFFAFKEWKRDESACIWMLNPSHLNTLSLGQTQLVMPREDQRYEDYLLMKDGAKFNNNSVALFPLQNSNRMVAQQGVFTLQGNSLLPLEREHNGKLVDDGELKKIILTPNLRYDVEKYLQISGVNDYTLFPDFEGLAKHINSTYEARRRRKPVVK